MTAQMMKKGLMTLATLGLAVVAGTQAHAQAQTIVTYNFDGTANTPPASVTPAKGTATFSNNFTSASVDVVFQSGPVGNKTTTSATGDYALRLNGGTGTSPSDSTKQLEEGKYIQFAFSTVGFTNLGVSYLTQRSNSGFTTQTFQYSTDGTTFTTLSSVTPTIAATANGNYNENFDLSGITGFNNDANAAFRIVFTGSTAGQSITSNDRIDDLSVNGTPNVAAAPEPSGLVTLAICAGLLGGLIAARRRAALSAS